MEVPRRWLRVKRNGAFGELPCRVATCRQTAVATCRQTVETLLAPLSTAWQRMATVKEPKEKGLLLPTPLSHKPT